MNVRFCFPHSSFMAKIIQLLSLFLNLIKRVSYKEVGNVMKPVLVIKMYYHILML